MFYYIFRRTYLKIKKNIEDINSERKEKETLPDGVNKTVYAYSNDGNELHQCNLYKVSGIKDTKKLPLIIDIHGGGWICGDKDTNDNFNYHLALKENNVSSLSYRTIDCCTIAEQIKDIFEYFHFLKDNSDLLNISFNRVMLTGDSAGAQLALLAYCINQSEKLQKLFSVEHVDISVKCLVLNHSVCYIDMAGKLPRRPLISKFISVPGMKKMLYQKSYAKDEIYLSSVNPTKYIHQGMSLPPVLLISSRGDKMYSSQTFMLSDYFNQIGIKSYLYYEKNEQSEHVFNISYPDSEEGKKCNDYIIRFFEEVN